MLVKKIKMYYEEYGLLLLLKALISEGGRMIGWRSSISRRRQRLGRYLHQRFSGRVYSGEFAGMLVRRYGSWDADSISAFLLGSYEAHIQKKLCSWGSAESIFIDIGSADGFFAVGLLRAGYASKSICFELSKDGQETIKLNAKINDVAEKLDVLGKATKQTLKKSLSDNARSRTLMLIDIEGGEYDLLDEETVELIKNCHVVLEIHEIYAEQRAKLDGLLARLSEHFHLDFIDSIPIDVNAYPILDDLHEIDRLLAFCESRPKKMRWIALSPKMS